MSPNEGENKVYFSGNSEGGRSTKVVDKAGVADGLSSIETIDVKNQGSISDNQRPLPMSHTSGAFKIGT